MSEPNSMLSKVSLRLVSSSQSMPSKEDTATFFGIAMAIYM